MFGVADKMSQYSSRQHDRASDTHEKEISPELREVLHMLDAIEHGVPGKTSQR